MFSVVAIGLLAFVAHAEEQAADPIADLMKMVNATDSEEFTDMLADKLVNKLSDHLLATSTPLDVSGAVHQNDLGDVQQNDYAAALNILGVDAQNDQNLVGAVHQLTQDELNRAANRGTIYEAIKYNSEVDQRMALEAEAAVALMNQRAARGAAPEASPQEEELVETSTDSISWAAVPPMACFVGLVALWTFAKRHFDASTQNKEAFMAGYSPINA